MKMSLDLAEKIIAAAVEKAQEMGNRCSVAIADDKGWLVALHRMDGALIPTVDIARDKAWTAAAFKMPSSEILKYGISSRPGFGLNPTNWNDRLTSIPGGLPIKDGQNVIGSIGVCGGTSEEDLIVCKAAIAAIFG